MRVAIGIPSRGIIVDKIGVLNNIQISGMNSKVVLPIWIQHFEKVVNESKKIADIEVIHEYNTLRNVSAQRNAIIDRVLNGNFDYLFFIDDDVFVPIDAIKQLLETKKPLVSGIYWNRVENSCSCIGYDWWNYEKKAVFPMKANKFNCGFGSGFGCCLIDVKILKKLRKLRDEPMVPAYIKVPNQSIPWGEDAAFFHKISCTGCKFDKINNFKPISRFFSLAKLWINGNVLCDHYDYHRDRFYPSDDICLQLRGKKRFYFA